MTTMVVVGALFVGIAIGWILCGLRLDRGWSKLKTLRAETMTFQDKAKKALDDSTARGEEILKAWEEVESSRKDVERMNAQAFELLDRIKRENQAHERGARP